MARNTSAIKRGWSYDKDNSQLDLFVDGTEIAAFSTTGASVNGTLAVTGDTAVTGALTSAGIKSSGRVQEKPTLTNVDTQNHTLTAANILAGLVVHTTVTGAATVTTDTAANIVSGCGLTANGMSIVCYYVNDGNQTATFAGGTGVTIVDASQTVATKKSAILLFYRVSATAVTCFIFGA